MVRMTWEPLFRGLCLTAAAKSFVSVSESIQTRKQDARLNTRLFDINPRAVSYPTHNYNYLLNRVTLQFPNPPVGPGSLCHVLTGECRTLPVLARKGIICNITKVEAFPP
ncbi:LOW QUALITY PROTEIN: hypothetical protein TorRG33x02_088400 [Trema orientale]|uniref:Uncharacterized protein n=1 Tax=Trema orientale TaxID=63057 RepID=A0A2P5FC07_TREOI|nr:LOW QUALITY PROTEIN: hypothetical protein TorRG33x02_088400 [Trema orientale]